MNIHKNTAKTFSLTDDSGTRHLVELRKIKTGARLTVYVNDKYTERDYTDPLLAYSDFAMKRGELLSEEQGL